jgi:hypothetical protein
MFFELQAIPQTVTRTREQYEDARDELLREYQAFTRFVLNRFDEIDLVFDARQGGLTRVGYNLPMTSREERARFLKYAATLRKHLRFSEADGPSNRDVRHARRTVTNVLDRHVDLILVGGLDERAVMDPRVLPPRAGAPLKYDPQLVAGTLIDTVTFSVMQLLGNTVKVLSGLDRPYLVPTVKRFAHHRGPRHWRHVLSALRHHPDVLHIRSRRRAASSAPEGEADYALLCLSYFLETMKDKLDPPELNRRAAMFRAVISKQPLYTIDVELAANNDVTFEALGRDTDPDLFERAHSSQQRKLVHSVKHPAALYTRLFSLDEVSDLLCPPYTFRDALEGVRHFVPKPFHAPPSTSTARDRSIVLGRLDDAQLVALALDILTRHLFITGSTGSGKTNTIKYLIVQLVAMGVPVLIIDPIKRDFERFVRTLDGPRVTVLDFSPRAIDQWMRFNPFIPPARISLYSHSVVLARTLAMLFPNNPVGFDILLQMIRQVYAWAFQIGSGGGPLEPESFHRLTGADLRRDRSLAPTFSYFLDVALDVVSRSDATGPVSHYTLETLDHFKRQFGNLRQSALAQVFSPRPGDEDVLQNCLASIGENDQATRVTLIQLHSWQDDREVNAFCALLFAMLYEQRQCDFGERSVAGGPLPLTHVTVIDEAHRLFSDTPNTGNDKLISPAREVASLMGHMMAECRALGQGLIVSEQSVSKIHPDALINSATKIVHSLGFGKDKEAVASSLALSAMGQDYLSFLEPGEALAVVPGVQQPLYITVPNQDAEEQSLATPIAQTACYILIAASDEQGLAAQARVAPILDALARDARFSSTVSLRVVRWPIDGPEPVVVELAERDEAPLTPVSHHELDDAFVVVEEDVRAHLYERPLALFLTFDAAAGASIGTRMRTLAERVDLAWVACELSGPRLADHIADQATLTVDLSGVAASAMDDAGQCVADTIVQLMTARGATAAEDAPVSHDGGTSEVTPPLEDSSFRLDVQNLIDVGDFDAATLLLGSAPPTAYRDLRRRLSQSG